MKGAGPSRRGSRWFRIGAPVAVVLVGLMTVATVAAQSVTRSAADMTAVPRGAAASATGQTSSQAVVVPGGIDFISSVMGMTPLRGEEARDLFMSRLLAFLEDPGMRQAARRLTRLLEEYAELRRIMNRFERRGDPEPSLANRGSRSHERAEELLDFFGLEPERQDGRRVLEADDDDTETLRREMLRHLGVSWREHEEAWLGGEPIRIPLREDEIPLLFGAGVWEDRVFERRLGPEGLFRAIVTDSRARKVYLGYARMDRASRDATFRQVGLRAIYRDEKLAILFPRFAEYLRFNEQGPVFPGGDRQAWREILGGWDDTEELLKKLAHEDEGRGAHLWRALTLVPDRRSAYLLTGGGSSRDEREEWAEKLYDRIRVRSHPLDPTRWSGDVAELFLGLEMVSGEERIAWPGGARAWWVALEDHAPIRERRELDEAFEQAGSPPETGREADLWLLRELIERSWPSPHRRDSGPTAIERFLTVSAALRHQSEAARSRVVPLLYRNYDPLRTAYGFFVDAGSLTAEQIEDLVYHLLRVDRFRDDTARAESLRQLQSTLMLLRRLIRNGGLQGETRDRVLDELVALGDQTLKGAFGIKRLGYGTGMVEWYRRVLMPALGGMDVDRLLDGLLPRVRTRPFRIAGIDYVYEPHERLRRRVRAHLEQQKVPPLGILLTLDGLLAGLEERARDGERIEDGEEVAERIRELVADLESATLESALRGELDDYLRVPVDRHALGSRSRDLILDLRLGRMSADGATDVRRALASWLGDALVGLVYATEMGDPGSLFYENRVVCWQHRLVPGEETEIDERGAWAPTAEWSHPTAGRVLANSLFGVPARIGRWDLEATAFEGAGGEVVDSVEVSWGATVGQLHPGSLTDRSQALIHRTHERATEWIRGAARARDPRLAIPDPIVEHSEEDATARQRIELAPALRRILRPRVWQAFVDAVEAGDEAGALSAITPGNRVLLIREIGGLVAEESRALEQTIGMAWGRQEDHLGLAVPSAVPYGEAGDRWEDPLLFSRLVDVRVALAVALHDSGFPAALHAPLLPVAMAEVLGTVEPDTMAVWQELVAAVPQVIDGAAVRRWVEELAFDDVLTPVLSSAAYHSVPSDGRPTYPGVPMSFEPHGLPGQWMQRWTGLESSEPTPFPVLS